MLPAIVLAWGCASRTLTIESDPPGADVILDRREVGKTPVTVDIRYGGRHEIILLKVDREASVVYRPAILEHDTSNFVLDTFPFDAFAELGGAEDHQVVRATLVPDPAAALYEQDRDALLQSLRDRAAVLRARTKDAVLEAPPRTPLEVRQPEKP